MRVMTGWSDDDGARGTMPLRRSGRKGGRSAVARLPAAPRTMVAWVLFVPLMLYGLYLIGAPFH
jgi:hypothetical protein